MPACAADFRWPGVLAPRFLWPIVARRRALLGKLCNIVERLARNEDDLYIFSTPPQDQDVVCQPIFSNPLVAFARADAKDLVQAHLGRTVDEGGRWRMR